MGTLVHDELQELWLLRHGQSLGNLANDAARDRPTDVLDIADRDMDVPLSDLGIEQATAFGTWLGEQTDDARPDVIVSSPYARALGTARHVVAAAGLDVEIVFDERLREREFGILDLLTHQRCRRHSTRPRRPAATGSASSTTARQAARAGSTSRSGCARCATRSSASTPIGGCSS